MKKSMSKVVAKVVAFLLVISVCFGYTPITLEKIQAASPTADSDVKVLKAFPSAEGFGQNAAGGRGGKVVAVTNLEDEATNPPVGSFRWAVQQYPGQPITVVFRVSGLIELKSELRVKRDNYTLAGQTAPGGGICIMGDKVNLGGSTNLIIRHLRFRVGTMNGDPDGKGSIGIENASNFIVDHCTFGWSGEENMTVYDNKMTTIQWCIIHEGLYQSGHNKGNRGYGAQWGGSSATYHHNLLAHNNTRSPRFNGARSNDIDVLTDFVNNVNYNWGGANSCYGGDIQQSSHRVNFVNNYYKPGPARPGTSTSNFIESSYGGIPDKIAVWYMNGNYMEGSANVSKNIDNYLGLNISRYPTGTDAALFKSTTPFTVPYPVTTQTALQAYNSVLDGAGAFPRDSVDTRIVQEVRTGTASGSGAFGEKKGIIDTPDAVGGYPTYNSTTAPADTDIDGMPDAWEALHKLDPNDASDGNLATLSDDGYTNFEMYLNELAGDHVVFNDGTTPTPTPTPTVTPVPPTTPPAFQELWDFNGLTTGTSYAANDTISGSDSGQLTVSIGKGGTNATIKEKASDDNYLEFNDVGTEQDGWTFDLSGQGDVDTAMVSFDFMQAARLKDNVLVRAFSADFNALATPLTYGSNDGRVFEIKTADDGTLKLTDYFSKGAASAAATNGYKGLDVSIPNFTYSVGAWSSLKLMFYKATDTVEVYGKISSDTSYTLCASIVLGATSPVADMASTGIRLTAYKSVTPGSGILVYGVDNLSISSASKDEPLEDAVIGISGNTINTMLMGEDRMVFAAKYGTGGVLTDISVFRPGKAGKQSFTTTFVPDKVFIWNQSLRPFALYKR